MIMDDDEMIRDLATKQITQLGHKVFVVEDRKQAITQYQEYQKNKIPIDLLIMDLTVPGGMGGAEATRELLKLNSGLIIVVASGYSNDPIMAKFREHGFYDAIAKPFDIEDLKRCINSVLG